MYLKIQNETDEANSEIKTLMLGFNIFYYYYFKNAIEIYIYIYKRSFSCV